MSASSMPNEQVGGHGIGSEADEGWLNSPSGQTVPQSEAPHVSDSVARDVSLLHVRHD